MAVTFDAAGPSSAGTAFTATPGTWTHVNGGNGILVGITIFTGAVNTVTGVTYGGVTVPFLGFIPANNDVVGGVALYGLAGGTCPAGSNTVSVAFSDAPNNHIAGSVSVSSAGSLGTPVTNFGNSAVISADVPGTTTGGLIVAVACQGSHNALTATSPNVLRWMLLGSTSTGADNGIMGTDPSTGGGATQTVTFGASGSADFWGEVAVEVLPPAAAGATPAPLVVPQAAVMQAANW